MSSITTPIGVARWPRLNHPDTKFDENGVYSCKLILEEKDYNELNNKIETWLDKEYARFCKELGKKQLRRATSVPLRINDDGEHEVYAKQAAQKETSKGTLTFSIALFDSQGKKLNNPPNVGNGSRIRLGVEPTAWFVPALGFGYTLRLKAAQIVELVEFNPSGAEAFSFDSEDGGYVSESLDEAMEETDEVPF